MKRLLICLVLLSLGLVGFIVSCGEGDSSGDKSKSKGEVRVETKKKYRGEGLEVTAIPEMVSKKKWMTKHKDIIGGLIWKCPICGNKLDSRTLYINDLKYKRRFTINRKCYKCKARCKGEFKFGD